MTNCVEEEKSGRIRPESQLIACDGDVGMKVGG